MYRLLGIEKSVKIPFKYARYTLLIISSRYIYTLCIYRYTYSNPKLDSNIVYFYLLLFSQQLNDLSTLTRNVILN